MFGGRKIVDLAKIEHFSIHCSYPNVKQLLEWEKYGNPQTCKWISAIVLEYPKGGLVIFDSYNTGLVGDRRKGKVAISLILPDLFFKITNHVDDKIFDKDVTSDPLTINLLIEMRKRLVIDVSFLLIDENEYLFAHEGCHRAIAAKTIGISLIPVYIYGNNCEIYSKNEWLKNALIQNRKDLLQNLCEI